MRGEHEIVAGAQMDAMGSSPHARGTLKTAAIYATEGGIIPACAGNTAKPGRQLVDVRDHPRMRGEHSVPGTSRWSHMGSSPHARGTPEVTAGNSRTNGIIPACAGNTFTSLV